MVASSSGTQNDPNRSIRKFEQAFYKLLRKIPDLKDREFGNNQQFRYFFPQWENMDNRKNYSVFYEMNDWNGNGKAEIRIDIQFWLEGFREIGEIIQQKKDMVAQKMPQQPTSIEWYINKKYPHLGRLQYCFPDSSNPEDIALCMKVLIDETKDDVNDWLRSKRMKHY